MPDTIAEALGLPERGLLSLVGAGGKTTVMFRLAAELNARGLRVACATTTKIFPPTPGQALVAEPQLRCQAGQPAQQPPGLLGGEDAGGPAELEQ